MESLHKDCIEIQVNNDQFLFKLFSPADNFAFLIKDKAVSIKYEFILTANNIQIDNNYRIVCCPCGEHIFPESCLADMIRRCIDIYDNLCPKEGLNMSGSFRVPYILAYIHAYTHITDGVYRESCACLKISVFIKDPVIGKVHLMIDIHNGLVVEYRSSIIDIVFPVNETDD